MSIESWIWFCAIEFVLCLSPGPSVLLVSSLAITGHTRSALLATSGVLTANAGYFLIAVLGLAAVIAVSAELFKIIKWAGAIYLVWLGLKIIFQSFRDSGKPLQESSPFKTFSQGFITQAANPNLIVYFSAILPQFIEVDASASTQVLILGISSLAIEGLVLSLYCKMGYTVSRAGTPYMKSLLNKIGGGMLVGSGMLLAFVKRTQDGA